MLYLWHLHGLQFGIDVRAASECVWSHHFNNDKIHFIPIILTIEEIGFLEGPQLAHHIYGKWVYDPQAQHIWYEAFLVNDNMIGRITYFWYIVLYGVDSKVYNLVVCWQVLKLWVHLSLRNLGLRRHHIIIFRRQVGGIYESNNMDWCFEAKCGYRILQLLVK